MKRFSEVAWQEAICFQRGAILAAERQRDRAKDELLGRDSSQAIVDLAFMTEARTIVQGWSIYKCAGLMQSIRRRNHRLVERAIGEAKQAERARTATIARTFGIPDIKEP